MRILIHPKAYHMIGQALKNRPVSIPVQEENNNGSGRWRPPKRKIKPVDEDTNCDCTAGADQGALALGQPLTPRTKHGQYKHERDHH